MASQLNDSSPLMMDPIASGPWPDSLSNFGDLGLGSDGASQSPSLMLPDMWSLDAGDVYAAPPLYPVLGGLSPPQGDDDMLDVVQQQQVGLDPFTWQGQGTMVPPAPVNPMWPDDACFDLAPPPPPPGLASFHADSPAWQAAPRGGGYRAPQRNTPPPRRARHQPAPPASQPLAATATAPSVKRSHSGTPVAKRSRAGTAARRASASASLARPPAKVESRDALPGALQGLVAMENDLRSANHEQQRLLSATYEQWDRRHSSASA